MLNKSKQQNDGFTIIEVLIVLAIAGLILLVVFMAVPALQRSSRNTQRKNDVSSVLGAVTEYTNNHAGQLPKTNGTFAASFVGSVPNFGYYTDATKVKWVYNPSAAATAGPAATDTDSVVVANYSTCDTTTNKAVSANATLRSIVVLYNVEQSGAPAPQCLQS